MARGLLSRLGEGLGKGLSIAGQYGMEEARTTRLAELKRGWQVEDAASAGVAAEEAATTAFGRQKELKQMDIDARKKAKGPGKVTYRKIETDFGTDEISIDEKGNVVGLYNKETKTYDPISGDVQITPEMWTDAQKWADDAADKKAGWFSLDSSDFPQFKGERPYAAHLKQAYIKSKQEGKLDEFMNGGYMPDVGGMSGAQFKPVIQQPKDLSANFDAEFNRIKADKEGKGETVDDEKLRKSMMRMPQFKGYKPEAAPPEAAPPEVAPGLVTVGEDVGAETPAFEPTAEETALYKKELAAARTVADKQLVEKAYNAGEYRIEEPAVEEPQVEKFNIQEAKEAASPVSTFVGDIIKNIAGAGERQEAMQEKRTTTLSGARKSIRKGIDDVLNAQDKLADAVEKLEGITDTTSEEYKAAEQEATKLLAELKALNK